MANRQEEQRDGIAGAALKAFVELARTIAGLAETPDVSSLDPPARREVLSQSIESKNFIARLLFLLATFALILGFALATQVGQRAPDALDDARERVQPERGREHLERVLREHGVELRLPPADAQAEPPQDGLDDAERDLRDERPDDALLLLFDALRALAAGEARRALELLDPADPRVQDLHRLAAQGVGSFANVFVLRGDAHFALGEWRQALENYELAAQLDPTNWIAHVQAGYAAAELELAGEALEHFDDALDALAGTVNETLALAHVGRGIVHATQGDAHAAAQDFAHAQDVYEQLGASVDLSLVVEQLPVPPVAPVELLPSPDEPDERVPVEPPPAESDADEADADDADTTAQSAAELYDAAVAAWLAGERAQATALFERALDARPEPDLARSLERALDAARDRTAGDE